MVIKHVWPDVDEDGNRRRRDSEMAAGYLRREIKTLTEQSNALAEEWKRDVREKDTQGDLNTFIKIEEVDRELWALKEQLVFHSLFTDIKAGMKDFVEVFDEASNKGRFSILKILLEQAEKFRERFSLEDVYEFSIRRVIWLLDERKTDEANQLLDSLMEEYRDGDKREVDMLTRLARLAEQEGNMPKAIKLFETAAEICNNKPALHQWWGTVLNSLGLMYRRMGKWKDAERNYHNSLVLIRKTGDPIKLASAYNNLGFIEGYLSDYDSALRYCHHALKIQQELNLRYDSGRTHNTLGIIYRSKEDYPSSLKHTNEAITIFREFKDDEWLSKAYCERGATKWHMHQLDQLPAADADLKQSLKLSEDANLTSEMVNILHIKGHIAWELWKAEKTFADAEKLFAEAETHFKRSAKLADQVHDFHQVVNNLEGLVELYYDIGYRHHENGQIDLRDEWYEKAKEMAEQWKIGYEDKGYDFPLYSGSRSRILGNIAYDRKEYEEALIHYMVAYPLIASRAGYSKYALNEALDWLHERIDQLPSQEALDWCIRLEDHWKREGLDEDFPGMLSVCEICRDNAERRAREMADNGGES